MCDGSNTIEDSFRPFDFRVFAITDKVKSIWDLIVRVFTVFTFLEMNHEVFNDGAHKFVLIDVFFTFIEFR